MKKERKAQIAALHAEGLSQTKIAAKLGVSEITVRRTFRQLGIPPKPGARAQFTKAEADKAVALYVSGLSMLAVQRETGIDDQGVRRLLDERGIDRRPESIKPFYPEETKAKAAALYAQGKSAAQVAEELDLKVHTIKDWMGENMRSMSAAAIIRCGGLIDKPA